MYCQPTANCPTPGIPRGPPVRRWVAVEPGSQYAHAGQERGNVYGHCPPGGPLRGGICSHQTREVGWCVVGLCLCAPFYVIQVNNNMI